MKLPNFVNPSCDSSSKVGHAYRKLSASKIELIKKHFYYYSSLKKNQKDSDDS